MTRLFAGLRAKFTRPDEMGPLEYLLAAAFLLVALLAALPGLAPALTGALSQIALRPA